MTQLLCCREAASFVLASLMTSKTLTSATQTWKTWSWMTGLLTSWWRGMIPGGTLSSLASPTVSSSSCGSLCMHLCLPVIGPRHAWCEMRNGFASQHAVLDCIVHKLHDASCLSKSIEEELKNVGGMLSLCGVQSCESQLLYCLSGGLTPHTDVAIT